MSSMPNDRKRSWNPKQLEALLVPEIHQTHQFRASIKNCSPYITETAVYCLSFQTRLGTYLRVWLDGWREAVVWYEGKKRGGLAFQGVLSTPRLLVDGKNLKGYPYPHQIRFVETPHIFYRVALRRIEDVGCSDSPQLKLVQSWALTWSENFWEPAADIDIVTVPIEIDWNSIFIY